MRKFKNYLCLTAVTCVCVLGMTGCGNSKKTSTSGNNTTATTEATTTNVAEDVTNNVGNAVEDVTDGVGNAVNDLVGNNGFETYEDAHKYFLETMGNYHNDAKFEIRDEDRNLNDYQEGSKGYHFHLYDTSKNESGELFGEFFVDATSGVIYKKNEDGTVTEYRTTNSTTTNNTNGTNNTTNGTSGTTKTDGTNQTGAATGAATGSTK